MDVKMKLHGAIRPDFNNAFILEYWEVQDLGNKLIDRRSKVLIKRFRTREEAEEFAKKNNINLPQKQN